MLKMGKIISAAAAAALMTTAMTGFASIASADDYVDLTFLPEYNGEVAMESADAIEVGKGTNSDDSKSGGRVYSNANNVTLDSKAGNKIKALFGQDDEVNSEYISARLEYIGQNCGIPTAAVNLTKGTYSMYYLGSNTNTMGDIEFVNSDGTDNDSVSLEKFADETLAYGYTVYKYQMTFDENFNGSIKFINTSNWLPNFYALRITDNPAYAMDFGSINNESETSMTLSIGPDSIVSGSGEIKSDNGTYTDNLKADAVLRYPYINLEGKKLTKVEVNAGINTTVDVGLKIGGNLIEEQKEVSGNDWNITKKKIAFDNLKVENAKGYVELGMTNSKNSNSFCGNYGDITLTYENIKEEPEVKAECTYSIDVPTINVEEDYATGVGASINPNGITLNKLTWTIMKGDDKMQAEYDASEMTAEDTSSFVIGLVVPIAVDGNDVDNTIKFDYE